MKFGRKLEIWTNHVILDGRKNDIFVQDISSVPEHAGCTIQN